MLHVLVSLQYSQYNSDWKINGSRRLWIIYLPIAESSGEFSSLLTTNLKIKLAVYKTVMLSVVLYGRETWFLTIKDKYIGSEAQN
jgi:hypothetical protein